jgi:hypothetical protein
VVPSIRNPIILELDSLESMILPSSMAVRGLPWKSVGTDIMEGNFLGIIDQLSDSFDAPAANNSTQEVFARDQTSIDT